MRINCEMLCYISIQLKYTRMVKRARIFHCLNGFKLTINAILQLWQDLRNEGKIFLLTSRLNQDPLENFFGVVRQRGGYNPTPNTQSFRLAMQHNMHIRLKLQRAATVN